MGQLRRGYRDPDPAAAVTPHTAEAHRFSLADSGVLNTPARKLLVINGMVDSIFPIEDSIIAATQGDNKNLVARGNRGHRSNPGAEDIPYNWLDEAVAEHPNTSHATSGPLITARSACCNYRIPI